MAELLYLRESSLHARDLKRKRSEGKEEEEEFEEWRSLYQGTCLLVFSHFVSQLNVVGITRKKKKKKEKASHQYLLHRVIVLKQTSLSLSLRDTHLSIYIYKLFSDVLFPALCVFDSPSLSLSYFLIFLSFFFFL